MEAEKNYSCSTFAIEVPRSWKRTSATSVYMVGLLCAMYLRNLHGGLSGVGDIYIKYSNHEKRVICILALLNPQQARIVVPSQPDAPARNIERACQALPRETVTGVASEPATVSRIALHSQFLAASH